MSENNARVKIIYEVGISALAVIAVIMAFADILGKIDSSQSIWYWLDLSILLIFSIDYVVRLIMSDNKKRFFVMNIFDLIAIVPFSSFFRAFRIARLARLTRLIKFAKLAKLTVYISRFGARSKKFLQTNGLIYILFVTIGIILVGAVGIYLTEDGLTVHGFNDAVWWAFVTATTVGYGDISPSTDVGRIFAGLLMLTGIGTIGMLTGTIATYFVRKGENPSNNIVSVETKSPINLNEKFNSLSEENKGKVQSFIDFLYVSSGKSSSSDIT